MIQSPSSTKPADPALEAELGRLATAPIVELRKRYREVLRSDPPKAFGPDLPRRIKPGSELVRTWNGKTYRVIVQPDGFAYEGKIYAGLSEIASLIAGTNWNGPRFFGLRSKSQGAADGN